MSKSAYFLRVNGALRPVEIEAQTMLADVLRDELGLQGCKTACDSAVCGACAVLLDDQPIAACSTFAFEAEHHEITTIEEMGEANDLHPLQTIFFDGDAFQCGFCTPGMILTVRALLQAHPDPDEATIREWLKGNLCRCTGYRMIIEAVQRAALAMRSRHLTEQLA